MLIWSEPIHLLVRTSILLVHRVLQGLYQGIVRTRQSPLQVGGWVFIQDCLRDCDEHPKALLKKFHDLNIFGLVMSVSKQRFWPLHYQTIHNFYHYQNCVTNLSTDQPHYSATSRLKIHCSKRCLPEESSQCNPGLLLQGLEIEARNGSWKHSVYQYCW